jgi:hypothetical protein
MNRLNESDAESTLRDFIKESLMISVTERNKNGEIVGRKRTSVTRPEDIYHIGTELQLLKLAPLSFKQKRRRYGEKPPKDAQDVREPGEGRKQKSWLNTKYEEEILSNISNLASLATGLVPEGREEELASVMLPWDEEGRRAIIWVKEKMRWASHGIDENAAKETKFLSKKPQAGATIPFPEDTAIVNRLLTVQPNVGKPTGKGEFLFALMTGGIAGGEGDIQVDGQNWEVKDVRGGPVRLGDKAGRFFRQAFLKDATVQEKKWKLEDLENGVIKFNDPEHRKIINNVLQQSLKDHSDLSGFVVVMKGAFYCLDKSKAIFSSFESAGFRISVRFDTTLEK